MCVFFLFTEKIPIQFDYYDDTKRLRKNVYARRRKTLPANPTNIQEIAYEGLENLDTYTANGESFINILNHS